MEWREVEKLAHWCLKKKFKLVNSDELIGEAYISFEKCKRTYRPELCNFATHFRTNLEWHIMDYLKYNSRLVHLPVNKVAQGETSTAVPIDEPIGASKDDGHATTLLDVLEGSTEAENAEEMEQAMWLSLVDDIYHTLTPSEKKCVPYIKRSILGEDGAVAPRPMRAMMWRVRQKLLNAKKELDRD